jgi:hypothetical protein
MTLKRACSSGAPGAPPVAEKFKIVAVVARVAIKINVNEVQRSASKPAPGRMDSAPD